MEESIREVFGLKEANPARIPTLSLAYVGDAVFELVVRTVLLEERSGSNGALFSRSLPYVSAVGQAKMTKAILPLLDEEEAAAFRRGKNTRPEHGAKNASSREYHLATGLEALVGYLYITGRENRLIDLIKTGMTYAGT